MYSIRHTHAGNVSPPPTTEDLTTEQTTAEGQLILTMHNLRHIESHLTGNFPLRAYSRQDIAAQLTLQNGCLSSATLLAAAIVPNISVMSFSHLCLGFPRLHLPATIPCIIVFSKPLCRVTQCTITDTFESHHR